MPANTTEENNPLIGTRIRVVWVAGFGQLAAASIDELIGFQKEVSAKVELLESWELKAECTLIGLVDSVWLRLLWSEGGKIPCEGWVDSVVVVLDTEHVFESGMRVPLRGSLKRFGDWATAMVIWTLTVDG